MSEPRIYKTFHAYQSYLDNFYSRFPDMKKASFSEQKKAFVFDGAPWIFSWSAQNYSKNVDILETVHNCEYLQKAWAPQFANDPDWQLNIVFEQIKSFQPDICVLYPPDIFTPAVLANVRNLVKHPVIVAGYDGMDRKNIDIYKDFDLLITCSDYISGFYKQHNKNTYTLPFGFDDTILTRLNKSVKPKYNIGFTGSIFPNVHDSRYEFLRRMTRKINIDIRSDFHSTTDLSLFSKNQLKRLIKRKDIKNYFGLWRIDKANKGAVYGMDMFQFIHDSKISLNMHGDHIAFAANVRLFEITGVGSCLLTDWKENIGELFEPEKEVITYRSVEEACDKARFLLKNQNFREKTAKAGQQRTLTNYTYKSSIPKLFDFFQKQL
jgi:spore maturation protein CgeB